MLVHTTPVFVCFFVIFSIANQLSYTVFFHYAANTFGYVTPPTALQFRKPSDYLEGPIILKALELS